MIRYNQAVTAWVATRMPIPAPLRRSSFRRLWAGMTASYAGDRLQQLGQAWLVATLTNSAISVGLIALLGTLPLLLLPIGGVIVERMDRRRLLIVSQLVGAAATALVALLVVTRLIAVWHIYAWAVVGGFIWLVSRPAYKVVLTEVVPPSEVRAAVALNSTTETTSLVAVNAIGSALLSAVGLPIAFILNSFSYLIAVRGLRGLPRDHPADDAPGRLDLPSVLRGLADGVSFLVHEPALLRPLLLTFGTVLVTAPAIGLLPALVHAQGGTIVEVGLLAGANSLGSMAGAIFAGTRAERHDVERVYATFGIIAAAALAAFSLTPLGICSILPLAIVGFIPFAESVWNTSRVRLVAPLAYQSRLQAVTTMAFTLGLSLGVLWGGIAIDRLGIVALVGGAAVLGLASLLVALATREPVGARRRPTRSRDAK